ncbi:hypothetical protein SORBI_3007G089600 [Sorghum bicolor]|uniref:Uncharacterized protein n=1 Tax=Sorghum bicolor TaxID=4558 RepID=A0A1B6PGJ2_SORBI|nr:hypothetical protein SORBI_3007G089600 [Sorghum bicolor]OQU80153.1 hypothetical protein SORBI_3007G089600 [Sorghum bicolor]OQU80154.1 hypothetical protein SORBI_3007G089600 [Sorghum bicolor]
MPLAADMEEDVLVAWPRTRSGCPSVFATASCQHMHVRCLMKIPDEGIALECLARHPSINEDFDISICQLMSSHSNSLTRAIILFSCRCLWSHRHLSRISRTKSTLVIYVKGYPEAARCGLSALAVRILQQYGVPIW